MRKVEEIQVSGNRCFPGDRWREAILHYFFGLIAEEDSVTYRPKINFDGVTLRLHDGRYYAYGEPDRDPLIKEGMRVESVDADKTSVELGLVALAKNPHIHALRIMLPETGEIRLVKGERRGELLVSARSIPANLLAWGKGLGLA